MEILHFVFFRIRDHGHKFQTLNYFKRDRSKETKKNGLQLNFTKLGVEGMGMWSAGE